MSKKFDQIIKLLDDSDADYELIEHEPAVTSPEAEIITGWSIESGAKSILFKLDGDYLLAIVRGPNRVDFKKLRGIMGVRKARLATPEEVLDVMGVEIGACYPFGSIAGVQTVVDETLADFERITFSPGTHIHHIRIAWDDYKDITNPRLVDLYLDEAKTL